MHFRPGRSLYLCAFTRVKTVAALLVLIVSVTACAATPLVSANSYEPVRVVTVEVPAASSVLAQNTPNPFNPTTRIRFQLAKSEHATLSVHDASGHLVRVLVDEVREAGTHDVVWDGKSDAGTPVGSGVYFYRLTAGKFSDAKKMVLLK